MQSVVFKVYDSSELERMINTKIDFLEQYCGLIVKDFTVTFARDRYSDYGEFIVIFKTERKD